MSNALALAAVTATLRDLIETGIETDPGVSGISVTTRPLDRARDTAFTNGHKEPGQMLQALISTSDGHALIIR